MWKRKVLKKRTKEVMKVSYWQIIAVCFLTAMLTTSYTSSTTFFNKYATGTYSEAPLETTETAGSSNSDVISDTVGQIKEDSKPEIFSSKPLNTAADFFINMYTSGKSIFFSFLKVVNSLLTDHSYLFSLFLSVGAITSLLFRFLVSNIVFIGERRFFLEVRSYKQTRISKIFYLYKLRYIRNPAWVMLCRNMFQWLWNLTIIGGFIKYHEYSMIPFILAENPAIDRKEAFQLSKQLMQGNKWKLFILHLSFAGWHLLAFFTLGILDFIFLNPYITGTDAELYMELRRSYVLCRHPGYEALKDSHLEHVPSEDELLISKALYDDSEGPYTKISYFSPEQYPAFLYSIQPPVKAVKAPVTVNRKYGYLSSLFLILTFSIFGWVSEGFIRTIRDGVLPSKSFLFGPWIPLYGLCGLFLLVFIKKIAYRPIPAFAAMVTTYAAVQLCISLLIEYIWNVIPADYTGYFLSLDARTLLSGAILFALMSCVFLYYLAPRWNDAFQKLPIYLKLLVCTVLCILFVIDIVYALQHPELFSELASPSLLFM